MTAAPLPQPCNPRGRHCWHTRGEYLDAPISLDQVCCWCDRTRRVRQGMVVAPRHGPYWSPREGGLERDRYDG
jgi:hypothetical protein